MADWVSQRETFLASNVLKQSLRCSRCLFVSFPCRKSLEVVNDAEGIVEESEIPAADLAMKGAKWLLK